MNCSRGNSIWYKLRPSRALAENSNVETGGAVSDNGIGIDPGIADNGKDGHFGLQGMRELAGRISGNLTLRSSSTSGTEIALVVSGNIIFQKTTPRSAATCYEDQGLP